MEIVAKDNSEQITVEDQIKNIMSQLIWMQEQMFRFRKLVSKPVIKKIIDEVYDEECHRLEALRDDAVKVLCLLVDKGIISQEGLNEVTQR